MTKLSVSRVVNVSIQATPTFPKRKGFGLLLIVGTSDRLNAAERFRFFQDMDDVATAFSATDPEYLAAQVAFSQKPRPSEIAIGRWFEQATAGSLLGGRGYEQDVSAWAAVTDGSFHISVDGAAEVAVSGLDFSGVTNLNGVASKITTKLTAAVAGATCTFDGERFIFKSGTTGANSVVAFMKEPSGAPQGTDIVAMLATRASDKGITSAGVAAEATATAALDALQAFDPSWYGLMFAKVLTDDQIVEIAKWTEARIKLFGFTTKDSDILDPGTDNIGKKLMDLKLDRTFWTYDNDDPYQVASAFSRAFTVNFTMENSTITLKFKQLPGTTPVNLTPAQANAIEAVNGNYYSYFGDSAMLANGIMASGRYFDEVHGCDWLQNAIETNVFGVMYTAPKIPQTDKGVTRLVQAAEQAGREAVRCGLAAPGQWNGEDLGEIKNGDFLAKGFYVYALPIREQNQSDREARKAPPIQMLVKGAGAIHSADIAVTFER